MRFAVVSAPMSVADARGSMTSYCLHMVQASGLQPRVWMSGSVCECPGVSGLQFASHGAMELERPACSSSSSSNTMRCGQGGRFHN